MGYTFMIGNATPEFSMAKKQQAICPICCSPIRIMDRTDYSARVVHSEDLCFQAECADIHGICPCPIGHFDKTREGALNGLLREMVNWIGEPTRTVWAATKKED